MDFAIGLVKHVVNLPLTVVDPDLQIRGRGRGAVSKIFFSALRASQFDLKIRRVGAGPLGLSPRSATVSEELLLIKSFLGWLK